MYSNVCGLGIKFFFLLIINHFTSKSCIRLEINAGFVKRTVKKNRKEKINKRNIENFECRRRKISIDFQKREKKKKKISGTSVLFWWGWLLLFSSVFGFKFRENK